MLVQAVSTTPWHDDKIECVIVGGESDGRQVRIWAVRLREVPSEGVPVREEDERPTMPGATSALLGYVSGEVHLAEVVGAMARRLCDGGEVAEWQYGTVADVTCVRCLEMGHTSLPEQSTALSQPERPTPVRKYVLARNRNGKVHFTEEGNVKCGAKADTFQYGYGDPSEVNCSRCLIYSPESFYKPDVMPEPPLFRLTRLDGRAYHLRLDECRTLCGTKGRKREEDTYGPLDLVECKKCRRSERSGLCRTTEEAERGRINDR